MSKIHVFPDENLGGVLREYIEVDRKAEVGEYIFTINTKEIHKVTKGSEDGVYIDGWVYVYDGYYRTLEPTSIVHIDGVRYRLVDRKAKVGEKVIVVVANDSLVYRNAGEIVEIIKTNGDTFGGLLNPYDLGEKGAIYHFQYLVLEPLHTCDKCGKPLGETACSNQKGGSYCSVDCAKADDETEASKTVLDLLANLAQRVTELERNLTEVDSKVEMTLDDIVTLDERTQPLVTFMKAVKGDE